MRFIFVLITMSLLSACASVSDNPTTFPYQINRELLAQKPIKKVVVATANFSGEPTRHHLKDGARRINALAKAYLSDNGYQLAPDYLFDNAWNQAIRTYGNMYDPTTGRVDPQTWRAVLVSTASALKQQGDIDAIVFTDVIEHDVQHSGGMQHYARWYGVTRKPALQGPGSGVPVGFDWNQSVKAASLAVNIYTIDLEGVFTSRGGLDVLQAIDLKMSNPSFVRRKKILNSDSHLEEGVELAFHPFIPMKDYPGPSEAERAAAAAAESGAATTQ